MDVRILNDRPYTRAADAGRRRLDLYLPQVLTPDADHPLLVFIHGGAWVRGDKSEYAAMGRAFAAQGVALAAIEYRLSNEASVRHPDHARDGAEALAWLIDHADEYGYSRQRIFILGHSAGAHMAATWVTDPLLLKDAGVPAIGRPRGYIGLAGIYDVAGLIALHPQYEGMFAARAFGPDQADWRAASPINYPPYLQEPWLLLHSHADELVDFEQSPPWADHLLRERIEARVEALEGMSHYGALTLLEQPDSPLFRLIADFIARW